VRLGGSGTRWWRSFSVLGQAGGRPSNWLHALARFENLGGTSSRMSPFSAAKRRPRMSMRWRRAAWWERDAVVAELSSLGSSRRSTLQLIARGSAIRKLGRDIVSHVPFFSREAASEDLDEVAACGLVGAGRGGGGAFQSWVKPEVDPPIGCARQRDSKTREGHRLACPIFQPRSGVPAASALGDTTRDAASRARRAAGGGFGGAPRPGRREE
jgi:hypothetical protein